MPFQVLVTVSDQGQLQVQSPAPPPVVAKVLREALALVEGDVLFARLKAAFENERRIELAPSSALAAIDRNGRAPI